MLINLDYSGKVSKILQMADLWILEGYPKNISILLSIY